MGLCWHRQPTKGADKSLIGRPKDSENILMHRKVFIEGKGGCVDSNPIGFSNHCRASANRIKAVLIRSNGFLWISTFGHASWSNGYGGQRAH